MIAYVPDNDISEYIDSEGSFTPEGAKKLRSSTDSYFEYWDKLKKTDDIEHEQIKRNINEILGSHGLEKYSEIAQIVSSNDFIRLSGWYEDFKVFKTSVIICKIESQYGIRPVIYDICKSLEEYEALKNKTLYFFRRIMMLCNEEDIAHSFNELMDKNVSVIFIIQMLRDLEKIGDKGYVGLKLADLFNNIGKSKDAITIMTFVKENYSSFDPTFRLVVNEKDLYICKKKTTICFITCVNDTRAYEECLFYINRLLVPDNCSVDTIAIYDATSMAAGYNAAMNESSAHIKVYLHQDVCILNPFFLYEVIRTFESNEKIGMIGLVGSPILPPDAMMWHGYRIGNLYKEGSELTFTAPFYGEEVERGYVEAIDGLLMITNRDINWRDDIFDGWHFYDISQSKEFIKAGYFIVVQNQISPWVVHDDGILNLQKYNGYRVKYMQEYAYGE